MNTSELMVDDWIMLKRADREPSARLVLVVGIVGNDCVLFDVEDGFLQFTDADVSPIPLTHEILLLNGFKTGKANSLEPDYIIPGMPNPSYGLEKKEGFFCITDHAMMRLRYVHELQNALRLCGLYELAKNFKV